MQKKIGIHFYVNIANLDDDSEAEEKATNEVRHWRRINGRTEFSKTYTYSRC